MKTLDIAIKDLFLGTRSVFGLVFMFGIPLLITGMFYLMFGGGGTGDDNAAAPPITRVVLANLDESVPGFQELFTNTGGQAVLTQQGLSNVESMGELLVHTLSDETLSTLMELTLVDSQAAVERAVDNQEAAVGIIIPAQFTAAITTQDGNISLQFFRDPKQTVGPEIVHSILNNVLEGFSAHKITIDVAINLAQEKGTTMTETLARQAVQASLANMSRSVGDSSSIEVVDLNTGEEEPGQAMQMISLVMAGMMVFYAYFTGASTAQSILAEEEAGTLARLFMTPTGKTTILGGKFLTVAITAFVQVGVLMVTGRYVFNIDWGDLPAAILGAAGLIVSSAAFGIFLMSMLKNSRQVGVVYGGVLSVTGMIGIIKMFTGMGAEAPSALESVSLIVPQGWSLRAITMAMDGAAFMEILPTFGGLVVWSVVLFWIGNTRIMRRF